MIKFLPKKLRPFARDESGAVTAEFVVVIPVLFAAFFTVIDVSVYTVRATMLERSLDMVSRDIRLDTGIPPQYEEIKQRICDNAAFLPDCEQNLRLEMIPQNMYSWTDMGTEFECIDRASEVSPVRMFTPGQDNEMMIMRACAKVPVLSGLTTFTKALKRDSQDNFTVVSTSAFVQEPR